MPKAYSVDMMANSLKNRYYPVDLMDNTEYRVSCLVELTLNTWQVRFYRYPYYFDVLL